MSSARQFVNPINVGDIPQVLSQTVYAPDDGVSMGIYGLNQGLVSQLKGSVQLTPSHYNSVLAADIVPDRPWATPMGGSSVKFTRQQPGARYGNGMYDHVGDVRASFTKSTIQQGRTVISAVAMLKTIP